MESPDKTVADTHVARKIFHALSITFIIACMIYLPRSVNWLIYFTLGGLAMGLDVFRHQHPPTNQWLISYMRPFMREHESKKMTGSTYSILGIGLSYLIFPEPIPVLATIFLAYGDPIASFVGLNIKSPVLYRKKSVAGLLGGTLSCIIAAMGYFYFFTSGLSFTATLACGLMGGIAESAVIGKWDDNLTQPLISSLGLFALGLLWPGVFPW